MKTRTKLVSNSSSSSFICIGEKPTATSFIELKGKTKKNVLAYAGIEWDPSEKVYLTEFISDGLNLYYQYLENNRIVEYCKGNHGGPYWEEDFVEVLFDYRLSVWIRKEDYVEEKKSSC